MKTLLAVLFGLVSLSAFAADSIELSRNGRYLGTYEISGFAYSPTNTRLQIKLGYESCRVTATAADVQVIREMLKQAPRVTCDQFSQDPRVWMDDLWVILN